MRSIPEIDQVFRSAVEDGDVPGVVAAATTEDGPLYIGAFGKRDLGGDTAMTADSVFWIASMTKAITSTAAMQLVEQGKLSLDAPLGDLLPPLKTVQVLEGFDASGAPRLRPPARPITLHHLLTHTAGFAYDIWNPEIGRYMEHAKLPGIITCQNDALKTPLAFDPGARWHYGINIDWVGKAVEAASGERLDQYLRNHILDPLGMTDTCFIIGPAQRARLTGMHARNAEGGLDPIPFEVTQTPEFHMGGGGLYGTAPDYLRFLRAMLGGGRLDGVEVLKRETAAAMARNQIGDLKVERLATAIPAYSNDAEMFPGMVQKWGYGFLINTERGPAGRSAGSLTWAGLGNTYFWIDPTKRVAGVILTQILPFADERALKTYAGFESALYAAL